MIAIRKEIEASTLENHDTVLKNAPHTLAMLTTDVWNFPYTRETAAFPLNYIAENKFWPTVRRTDDAYGDRNLVCSCAPIEAYMEN
jgi:glycine dehydrogenase